MSSRRIYGSLSHADEARKVLANELAALLHDGDALETVRRLQGTPVASPDRAGNPPIRHGDDAPELLDWERADQEGRPGWARRGADGPSGRVEWIAERPEKDVERVCLVGESAAHGYFYAPFVSPAEALGQVLGKLAPHRRFEVVDITRPGLSYRDCVRVTRATLLMAPSVVIVYAGNNWLSSLHRWVGRDDRGSLLGREPAGRNVAWFQRLAPTLRDSGAPGLMLEATEDLTTRAEAALDVFAALSRETKILVAVPAVNVADVEVLQPLPWLAADGVARWYAAYERARKALSAGDLPSVERAAREMTALDGGISAISLHLLGRALLGQGRAAEGERALSGAVDASTWTTDFGRAAGIPSRLREVLLSGCRARGIPCLDVHAAFTEHLDGRPVGLEMLLDHSHLSSRGIFVGACAMADAVLDIVGDNHPRPPWQEVSRSPPALPEEFEALVRFHSALYNLHLNKSVCDDRPAIFDRLLAQALEACPGIAAAIEAYLVGRYSTARALLSRGRWENAKTATPLYPQAWIPWDLPVELHEAAAAMSPPVALSPAVEDALVRFNAVDRVPIDLTNPRYVKPITQATVDYSLPPEPALYQARLPWSTFWLAVDRPVDLALRLTARLPTLASPDQRARVAVNVDDKLVGEVMAGSGWTTLRIAVAASNVRRGVNRLVIDWPLPPDGAGDRAIAFAVSRLQRGLPADLWPVFGEVFELLAGPA